MNVFLLFVFFGLFKTVYTLCRTPNGEVARCIRIKQCQVFLDILKEGVQPSPSVLDFMRNSSCGFDNGPLVCCGSFNHSRELTPVNSDPRKHKNFHLLPTNCGLQEVDDMVLSNDAEAQLDEFPWMGLLQFYDIEDENFRFSYGATLINTQYALTVAHCVLRQKPFSVRFGEHDLTTEIDCRKKFDGNQNYELCVGDYQDIGIDRIIIHPAYDQRKKTDDIALIRLARPVKITANVRPVCLPLNQEKYPPGKRMVVAGWGSSDYLGEASTVKRKASLPIIPKEQCEEFYSNRRARILDQHICAGGEAGVDTCQGDGGNALVTVKKGSTFSQWYMEGMVSFGVACGLKDAPSVYTRVSSYVNWILDRME